MIGLWLRCVACAGMVLGAQVLAWAQEAQREFVPAESVTRQELAPGPLVYGAYAFVWAAVLVYVFLLWRRLGRVERELGDVNRKLARK